jgi:hypothetical protein
MKITILSFSLTGNTKLAATRIGAKLAEGNQHTVEHINLLKLNKEIDSLDIDSSPRLIDARASIQASHVVALAGFANFIHPSWAIDQPFADSILPSEFRFISFRHSRSTLSTSQSLAPSLRKLPWSSTSPSQIIAFPRSTHQLSRQFFCQNIAL